MGFSKQEYRSGVPLPSPEHSHDITSNNITMMPLQCSPSVVAARAFLVKLLQMYGTKQFMTKWVPHEVHAQCYEWSQLLHSLFTKHKAKARGCGVRETDHTILPNLLFPYNHWFNAHKFEQTLGDSGGQRNLACCSPWGSQSQTRLSDWTTTTTTQLVGCELF